MRYEATKMRQNGQMVKLLWT